MSMPRVVTHFWKKPLPIRTCDWLAFYDGDEPNDVGSMPYGEGATEAQAVADLIENYPRGIACEQDRHCRDCIHLREQWSRAHDGSDDCRTVCGLHSVNGGWDSRPVDSESVCSDHEFEGERQMARTLPAPVVQDEIKF
jgi:hypothetical protein